MRTVIVVVAVLAMGLLTAVPTAGQQFFTAVIDGLQPVPPSGSPGTGFGCVALNPDGTISFHITFSGLLAPEVATHFHGPAPAGENAAFLMDLPMGSPKVGTTVALTPAQQADLIAGLWYINIHSELLHTGGELRGQVLMSPTPCQTVTGVGDPRLPSGRSLSVHNYPNPFAWTTVIQFSLPAAGDVLLEVFDVAGRRLVSRTIENAPAGPHRIPFDGSTHPNGVYFYQIVTHDGQSASGKMLIRR